MDADRFLRTVLIFITTITWIVSCGYGTLTVSLGPILFGAFCFLLAILIAASEGDTNGR